MLSPPCQAGFSDGVNSELFYPWWQCKLTSAQSGLRAACVHLRGGRIQHYWGMGPWRSEGKSQEELHWLVWFQLLNTEGCSHRQKNQCKFHFLACQQRSKKRKEVGKDWRRLKSKGWGTSPLVFGRLAWQLGICSASMKGRVQDQCVSHYAAEFQCRKCVKYEVKVQATEWAFWIYVGQ